MSNFAEMTRKKQRNFSQVRLSPNFSEHEEEQTGGRTMPLPPQNWPQNEKQATQSSNLSRDDSYDNKKFKGTNFL